MKHPHSHVPLLVLAVSVTLFVFALYGYMYRTVDVSLNKALAAREEVAKEQSLKLQEKKLTEMYTETTKDRARLASLFVEDTKTISFIETVEQ
ncbi:MAG: hypothetical protein M3Q80_00165, partial [bacterium]|nr:hypothetical protein [bacterium]